MIICFIGQVLINFRLVRDSDYIVFHSKNLTIVEKVSFLNNNKYNARTIITLVFNFFFN